ncbi:MAG: hypothetical protein ACXW1W_13455 [Methylococcaceae bacterium]
MSNHKAIGEARAIVLESISNRTDSLSNYLKILNINFASGTLPAHLMAAIRNAWEKPRACILTESTVHKWNANKARRGHDRPLKRQKDYAVKPWHELAYHIKQRNPKAQYKTIHSRLVSKYPDVSIHQLRKYFQFIKRELAGVSP